ncbi:MAG TPA: HlyD family efflux transporter periplasmic adaptor subunit [Candidatus Angelobacter sp.]|nr:HlyD family efflux transporter periplasmic adaptor subunit [Candidatus Angelobacter sp.]
MKKNKRALILVATVAGIAVLLALAFRPSALDVDVATVRRGPLQETLEQEGKTRMHDSFVLASPVAGRLKRIEIHAGDPVKAGQIVATIDPVPLEPQQRAALEARLQTAKELEREAAARVQRAEADNSQARSDLERATKLAAQGVIAREALEKAQTADKTATKELDAALFKSKAAAFQVEEARAALLAVAPDPAAIKPVYLRSPVPGRVLRLIEQSERVVSQGTPVVSIGYTPRLEIVADYLTTDAVKINSGMPALIEEWGGSNPIPARVRLVEPGAFTKISALGVEEQRVNVVLDFVSAHEQLGDAYRVEVRVITWQSPSVLKVPLSALFRRGDDWNVFIAGKDRASRRTVKIGHRSDLEAEVLDGLREGEQVIVHPGNELSDASRIRIRPSASK